MSLQERNLSGIAEIKRPSGLDGIDLSSLRKLRPESFDPTTLRKLSPVDNTSRSTPAETSDPQNTLKVPRTLISLVSGVADSFRKVKTGYSLHRRTVLYGLGTTFGLGALGLARPWEHFGSSAAPGIESPTPTTGAKAEQKTAGTEQKTLQASSEFLKTGKVIFLERAGIQNTPGLPKHDFKPSSYPVPNRTRFKGTNISIVSKHNPAIGIGYISIPVLTAPIPDPKFVTKMKLNPGVDYWVADVAFDEFTASGQYVVDGKLTETIYKDTGGLTLLVTGVNGAGKEASTAVEIGWGGVFTDSQGNLINPETGGKSTKPYFTFKTGLTLDTDMGQVYDPGII